jgi:glycyl-tRNA synthetase
MAEPKERTKSEKIEDIAKRRGFFWISSEIYGGLAGFYDYGHLGSALKRRWENLWRSYFLDEPHTFEIEAAQIMPEPVFIASGHLSNFIDPTARCSKCGSFHRADHIMEDFLKESFEGMTPQQLTEIIRKHNVRCPACKGPLEDVAVLNMMFPLSIGTGAGAKAYLRPETAQGVYVNFKRAYEHSRKALPFGLAIIGKAFRNEISPRNYIVRMREFTQAELQIFFDHEKIGVHPKFEEVADYVLRLYSVADRKSNTLTELSCADAVKKLKLPQFYAYHLAKIQKFYLEVLKLPKELFRFRELSQEERAFYNKLHWDIELRLESLGGFKEVGGLHYRTDHDLGGHGKVSKENLSVTVDGRNFVPHVLELSFGVDRNMYALIDIGLTEEKERTLMKFPRRVAPYDAGVFPLVNREGMPAKAKEIAEELREAGLVVFYDESGSIGRRYRRMDEVGVPTSITIDDETVKEGTVTLRDRDSMVQVRVPVKELAKRLRRFLNGESLEELGTRVKG